jgi:excisionase family DNA binding protein
MSIPQIIAEIESLSPEEPIVNADSRLLTAQEAAQHLGVPVSWVRDASRQGRLKSVRLGRYIRFRLSDLTVIP